MPQSIRKIGSWQKLIMFLQENGPQTTSNWLKVIQLGSISERGK